MKPHVIKGTLLLLMLLSFTFFTIISVYGADPSGGVISGNTTSGGPTRTPGSHTGARGTITTMVLTSVQQDNFWKAYVGNVTGSFTLDDANNWTIYSWALSGAVSGEVYASRSPSVTWAGIACANKTNIINESGVHSMLATQSDRINATFSQSIHKQFGVGSVTINQNTCNSTATYVNDTVQTLTTSSPYQEVLLQDTNSNIVYMTSIDDNSQGFNNQSNDFQMIVAEGSDTPHAYYFYVELT